MSKKRFRYKRKLNKTTFRLLIGSILLAACIAVASFLIIFHVKSVEIIGNTRNTEAEVKEQVLTGPFASNSLLISMLKKKIETPDLAFVESIQVEMVSSHKIRIHVNEKQIVGYVQFLDCHMYFDKDGIVVESQVIPEAADIVAAETVNPDEVIAPEEVEDENETNFHAAVTDVPFITGLEFDYVSIGDQLPIGDESVFNTVLGIARIVDKYEIQPDLVEFDEDYNITLYYGDVRVTIGEDDLLEEKITRVAAIIPKLTGKSGVLHMEDFVNGTINIIFTEDIPEEDIPEDEMAGEAPVSDDATGEDAGVPEESSEEEGSQEEDSEEINEPEEL